MGRTYAVETFGCQMNVHDSERLAGLLQQAGYEPGAVDEAAARKVRRWEGWDWMGSSARWRAGLQEAGDVKWRGSVGKMGGRWVVRVAFGGQYGMGRG